ncbi:sodium- and chloride-dependent glycine transporter 1-like isoform X2 [Artemia franciscana]|uniref:Transporter n=1 Tax=Artemia franciscana TaxID=6661 RepID=A0AA88HNL3_ARTSF|nr:hypothetical protein QYM36_009952 [Artemia franciscana]
MVVHIELKETHMFPGNDLKVRGLVPNRQPDAMDRTYTPEVVDENKERGNWSNKVEFMMSCFSYAVGLGTIWRFPYLCYRNGGGAFLIPYIIMYLLAGLPLFFMELAFGQYASEGPITIWKICPLFQGIGYAMFSISFLVAIYYNVIVAWSFYYLFASFTNELPWSHCENDWNTPACARFDGKNCTVLGGLLNTTGHCLFQNESSPELWDSLKAAAGASRMPADEYFHHSVLGISDGIEDIGGIRWQLALCLLLGWIMVFFALLKGVKSFGKAVYFTAIFPYVVMFILLIRAATLPGYIDGIMFYLIPKWERLTEAKVWGDAAMQIFFALSPCWGGLITLASYNTFHNNCFRDSLIVATGNILTAFFAGFVIFGIMGFMAHELGKPVESVATEGAGLAFIAYPEAVSRLPFAPIWSILFFVMLLTLGLGTQFTLLETVVTTIVDSWPDKLRGRNHKWVVLGASCVMFLLGLTMCTRNGMYVLQLLDNHAATFSALIVGLCEIFVIHYLYGVDRFLNDIKVMLKRYPPTYGLWYFMWKYLTPVVIIGLFIFCTVDFAPSSYADVVFPGYVNAIGWVISAVPISLIPIVAIMKISKAKGSLRQRIDSLIKPTPDWGPALHRHRAEADVPRHVDSRVPLTLTVASSMNEEGGDLSDLDPVLEIPEEDGDIGLQMKPTRRV